MYHKAQFKLERQGKNFNDNLVYHITVKFLYSDLNNRIRIRPIENIGNMSENPDPDQNC